MTGPHILVVIGGIAQVLGILFTAMEVRQRVRTVRGYLDRPAPEPPGPQVPGMPMLLVHEDLGPPPTPATLDQLRAETQAGLAVLREGLMSLAGQAVYASTAGAESLDALQSRAIDQEMTHLRNLVAVRPDWRVSASIGLIMLGVVVQTVGSVL